MKGEEKGKRKENEEIDIEMDFSQDLRQNVSEEKSVKLFECEKEDCVTATLSVKNASNEKENKSETLDITKEEYFRCSSPSLSNNSLSQDHDDTNGTENEEALNIPDNDNNSLSLIIITVICHSSFYIFLCFLSFLFTFSSVNSSFSLFFFFLTHTIIHSAQIDISVPLPPSLDEITNEENSNNNHPSSTIPLSSSSSSSSSHSSSPPPSFSLSTSPSSSSLVQNISSYFSAAHTQKENLSALTLRFRPSVALLHISLDIPRTLKQYKNYQKDGPDFLPLCSVIYSVSRFRPDIGYVQGMSYIAVMLLTNMRAFDAFCGMSTLLTQHHFLYSFYSPNETAASEHLRLFDSAVQMFLPQLHRRFSALGIAAGLYGVDWFMTLFVAPLPLDTAAYVWDRFMCDGEVAMIQAALGLKREGEKKRNINEKRDKR